VVTPAITGDYKTITTIMSRL